MRKLEINGPATLCQEDADMRQGVGMVPCSIDSVKTTLWRCIFFIYVFIFEGASKFVNSFWIFAEAAPYM